MFDIGFWELTLIAVVALLVVGPERLPRLARTAGLWVGRARRFVSTVKADIDRELAADELRKTLAKQAESTGLHEIIEETKQAVQIDQDITHKPDKGGASTEERDEADSPPKQQPASQTISSKPHDTNGQ